MSSTAIRNRALRWLLVVLFFLVLLFFYARFVELNWVETTHHEVEAPVGSRIRIAHLSDVHTRDLGRREQNVLAIVRKEAPDLIVVTGDTISEEADYDKAARFLKGLNAPLGVWTVRGNWEVATDWEGFVKRTPRYKGMPEHEFYQRQGVNLLSNEATFLKDGVWLMGVDDSNYGRPNFQEAAKQAHDARFRILLTHAPSYFPLVAGQVDLVLVGHTHGGQIHFPFLPLFYCPDGGCGNYVSGWYERAGSRLYVSRGVGYSIFPLRLGARPEVAIIDVVPQNGRKTRKD